MDSMTRNIKRHEAWEADEGFEWTQWQALQLQSIKEFRERNAALVDEAFTDAIPKMDEMITSAYHEGEQAFDAQRSEANAAKIKTYKDQGKIVADIPTDQLANAVLDVDQNGNLVWVNPSEEQPLASITQPGLDQIPDKSFFKVNEPKLKAVMDDLHTDMDKVRYAALNRMGSGYQEIIHKADIFYQTGTMTLQQAVDMASKEFLSAGLNCVEYENGRRVNIATYVEMALRTSARRAAMTAEGAKRDEWKEFLVISPALATTCPACYKYQALVMIDDVFAHGKPDGKHLLLSKAVDDNFLHPNCRHPLVSFFEGITRVPQNSPYDITQKNYDAEQRQRQIETMIRRFKRLRDGSVDPDNLAKYDHRVKQWEGLQKRHLAEHPELRRKQERETAYNVKAAGAVNNVSGGLSGARDPNSKEAQKFAVDYYGQIRKMSTDISRISQNTGMPTEKIEAIKNYVFLEKHALGDGRLDLFDPDYQMAQSWKRLSENAKLEPQDLVLLEHEHVELNLVKQGFSQNDAHKQANLLYNYDQALKGGR